MNNFKEWLSDYLRYFLLLLAAVLAGALVYFGLKIYQGIHNPPEQDAAQILKEMESDAETEADTEKMTEKITETDSEVPTEQVTEEITEKTTEAEEAAGQSTEDDTAETASSAGETAPESAEPVSVQASPETSADIEEVVIEAETEAQTEAPYTPVYKTLKGSCYIRSGPSMDAEIIGEYMYGTTVEFLEDVGGWYKVQIDGMIGYMGARFF